MVNLVIMESPTKASTVQGYLGSSFKVVASKGHVRDLPKSTLGIDVENHFHPHYINIRGKGDLIKDLKKEVKKADTVYLATDPDREGEAIAWHLVSALDIPVEKAKRVTFNANTKSVVRESIKKPRAIDNAIVDAQQTRRILDRLVGYKLSPFLWKNVRSGLSAGRVQSVATRIIVDKENEIRAFVPTEYWTIEAELKTAAGEVFKAKYFGDAASKEKKNLSDSDEAAKICADVEGKPFVISDIKKGKRFRNPAPPFTTSTMQQEASRKLSFQSQKTMKVAQELYEGINLGAEFGGAQGLITYMRTDSLRIAEEAQNMAKELILSRFGEKYYPETPRVYKSRENAQDAHEAIRPSGSMIEPEKIKKFLTSDQYKLYKLIWERFIASQMESAELSTVQAEIECAGHLFRASGNIVKFPGYKALYEESTDDKNQNDESSMMLPAMNSGDSLSALSVNPSQHFTEPPARFNEATLVKYLEEMGIGRPSTFATIISTITSRGYVKRSGKTLIPTQLGEDTTALMCEYFPDIVDCQFTASMESQLDEIEEGRESMLNVLDKFYDGFSKELDKASVAETSAPDVEETDMICEQCGAKMIIKSGRFGKFAACPNYPSCRNTKPLGNEQAETTPAPAGEKCELCGADLVIRNGRYGSFYACSKYPECKYTRKITHSIGVSCPKCGADIIRKVGKNKTYFYSCSKYPECDFSSWDEPTNEKCPNCGGMLFRKKGKHLIVCTAAGCGYSDEYTPEEDSGATE